MHTDIHAPSRIRTQNPEFERAKTGHASDHAATVNASLQLDSERNVYLCFILEYKVIIL
jgi:hypothetical protein